MTAPNIICFTVERLAARVQPAVQQPSPRSLGDAQRVTPVTALRSWGAGYIAGHALANGSPVAGAVCYLCEADTGTFVAKTISAADGSYQFSNLYAARKYRVDIVDPTNTYDPVAASELTVA